MFMMFKAQGMGGISKEKASLRRGGECAWTPEVLGKCLVV